MNALNRRWKLIPLAALVVVAASLAAAKDDEAMTEIRKNPRFANLPIVAVTGKVVEVEFLADDPPEDRCFRCARRNRSGTSISIVYLELDKKIEQYFGISHGHIHHIDNSFGLPSVRVPVLSITSVFTLPNTSNASAFFTKTPTVAPRPVPTMIDIGVANPNAQGQAIIRTATALTSA